MARDPLSAALAAPGRRYAFATVDVFTDRRFTGNPLAVLPDARGLSDAEMQALAAEFNLSETAFVLPPADPAHAARVRIFHRTAEMPFAGHPLVGAAYVLANGAVGGAPGGAIGGVGGADAFTLEVPAGAADVRLVRNAGGEVTGAVVGAPAPLALGPAVPAETVAGCAGLAATDVVVDAHDPVVASVGTRYVIAEVSPAALGRATPDLMAFRQALAARPDMGGRFSLFLYARPERHGDVGEAAAVRARMFAPVAGTWEDPATGSASAALGALLLSLSGEVSLERAVIQGVELGRASRLRVAAWRAPEGVRASVGGDCVPVLRGEVGL